MLRSQPWWQSVERLSGEGDTVTPRLEIGENVIQWRLSVRCSGNQLTVEASGQDDPLIRSECPDPDVAYAVEPGPTTLEISTDGTWELLVEQQTDVPLEEPPLPAMTLPTSTEVATAPLYDMERSAEGRVRLFRFQGGRYGLRLEDFYVTPNVDLELRFSSAEEPRTTREFMRSGSEFVAPLDVTAGSLNFLIPRDVDPAKYKSLVIWCPPLKIAYAGATLEFAR